MRRTRLRYVFALAILAWINGCVTWKPISVSTAAPPAISSEHSIRVTRDDQTVIVLEHPRIVGDSLTGEVGKPPERVAMALHDIQRIDERHVSWLRTGGLALGVTIAVLSVAFLVALIAFVRAIG